MFRRPNARLSALIAMAIVSPLAGCGSDDSNDGALDTSRSGPRLHIVATVPVDAAFSIVATKDELWVLSGGTGIATQVDPATNSVVKEVSLPHPAAYGTLAYGSLWLVSYADSALMELDPSSGQILRTIEKSPGTPLNDPVGITAAAGDLWVVNHHESRLLRINPRTATLISSIHLPGHYAADPVMASGRLWIPLTQEGLVVQVDPTRGRIIGTPTRVATGLCAWASVTETDIWYTSMPAEDFNCRNGTSRLDTTTGAVSPLPTATGRSLYTFARFGSSLWATDQKRTLYQVDESAGTLRPALTFAGKADANHLFTAFGSLWVTRSGMVRYSACKSHSRLHGFDYLLL